jgi:hypothetical protein
MEEARNTDSILVVKSLKKYDLFVDGAWVKFNGPFCLIFLVEDLRNESGIKFANSGII